MRGENVATKIGNDPPPRAFTIPLSRLTLCPFDKLTAIVIYLPEISFEIILKRFYKNLFISCETPSSLVPSPTALNFHSPFLL